MSTAPRILAIGTCRIFRPLRRMDAAGHIDLLHYGKTPHWWFTHTAAEGLQYLRALAGEIDIPTELRPLVCETTVDLPDDLSTRLPAVDAVVVEVSTFKTLEVSGFRLNLQNVWGYAKRAGVPEREALSGAAVTWPADYKLLENMRIGRASREQVHHELLTIRDRVRAPMLTVDHLYATTESGDPVPGRQDITDTLAALEATSGVAFHCTRPVIEEHSEQVALQDVNHYRPEFETVVGEALLESLLRVVRAGA